MGIFIFTKTVEESLPVTSLIDTLICYSNFGQMFLLHSDSSAVKLRIGLTYPNTVFNIQASPKNRREQHSTNWVLYTCRIFNPTFPASFISENFI